MDASRRKEEAKDAEETKASGKRSREKPGLSPIEEETDSPDSSGDSVINFRGIDRTDSEKKWPYDLRVSLSRDYEEVIRDLEEEVEEEKQPPETPPFLTARNGSDCEAGSKSGDSSTTSYERNTPDDDPDDSSFPGESTSGEANYYYDEKEEEEDDENAPDIEMANFPEMSQRKRGTRPKSAPASVTVDSSGTSREDQIREISTIVDWLRVRLVKSERDICSLKKQLNMEKVRSYKFAQRYDEDRNMMKESLRLDLELWIKKLNDGLKSYLAEWQQRERLRLNEEISRISDLYSQEIARSLKISLKEWQTEDSKKMFEIIEKRDQSRQEHERANAKAIYAKIQTHLENLEKRNRKSYASFRKHIDKWEDRLKDEVVKLHEENLKKLRQQVDMGYEDGRPEVAEPSQQNEEDTKENQSCSFPGADALLQVEENLLKRLRESSSKDLRRTEQIVRTELKAQRRELAKRMNDKISELWMAFEEFGCVPSVGFERSRSRRSASGLPAPSGRNDLDGTLGKDSSVNPDVLGGRFVAGKIVRAIRTAGSTRSVTDLEDGDRDSREDDDGDDDILSEEAASRKVHEQSAASHPFQSPDSSLAKDSSTKNRLMDISNKFPDGRLHETDEWK